MTIELNEILVVHPLISPPILYLSCTKEEILSQVNELLDKGWYDLVHLHFAHLCCECKRRMGPITYAWTINKNKIKNQFPNPCTEEIFDKL